jgi:hypothetical protein
MNTMPGKYVSSFSLSSPPDFSSHQKQYEGFANGELLVLLPEVGVAVGVCRTK